MKTGVSVALAALLAAACTSCASRSDTKEAVERGVLRGVAQRGVNIEAMDVRVTSVQFHDGKADAVVAFTPKGGKLSDGLTMRYALERKGEEWVIAGRSQMDVNRHAKGVPAPSVNDPQAGSQNQSGNPLPDPARPLPPGHPPLSGNPQ